MVSISRRNFLIATGWVAAGVTGVYALSKHAVAVAPTIIFPDETSGAAWVQIRPGGVCHMFFPRVDMGQNANTGLAQIVAEELNIDVEDIQGVQPSTSDVPPLAVTAGSMSLTAFSRPLAIAAATLREGLRDRAAAKLGEPVAAVLDDVGGFQTSDRRKVSYADLVDDTGLVIERESDQAVPALYAFDSGRQKTQVGHPKCPLGIRDLVTGGRVYTADVPMTGFCTVVLCNRRSAAHRLRPWTPRVSRRFGAL